MKFNIDPNALAKLSEMTCADRSLDYYSLTDREPLRKPLNMSLIAGLSAVATDEMFETAAAIEIGDVTPIEQGQVYKDQRSESSIEQFPAAIAGT
jgi:hypothetical protein